VAEDKDFEKRNLTIVLPPKINLESNTIFSVKLFDKHTLILMAAFGIGIVFILILVITTICICKRYEYRLFYFLFGSIVDEISFNSSCERIHERRNPRSDFIDFLPEQEVTVASITKKDNNLIKQQQFDPNNANFKSVETETLLNNKKSDQDEDDAMDKTLTREFEMIKLQQMNSPSKNVNTFSIT
jgi:hypothetical protein